MERPASLRRDLPTRVAILLVEGHPGDVRLTRRMLRDEKLRNELHVAPDGVEALAFLRREGIYAGAARPDLVLLDLDLPRKDGREVLEEMKRDSGLREIPVVVITSSRAEAESYRALQLRADGFVSKPVDLRQLARVIQDVAGLWMTIETIRPELPPTQTALHSEGM